MPHSHCQKKSFITSANDINKLRPLEKLQLQPSPTLAAAYIATIVNYTLKMSIKLTSDCSVARIFWLNIFGRFSSKRNSIFGEQVFLKGAITFSMMSLAIMTLSEHCRQSFDTLESYHLVEKERDAHYPNFSHL